MTPVFSALSLLAWPVSITAALAVFGLSSETTLSLLHQNLSPKVVTTSLKSSMPGPTIHMPDTPRISHAAAQAKLVALDLGRNLALGSVGATREISGAHTLRMKAATGLTVRAKPTTLSAAVGTLAKGKIVAVKSKDGGWLLIEPEIGQRGWVFSKYLVSVPVRDN